MIGRPGPDQMPEQPVHHQFGLYKFSSSSVNLAPCGRKILRCGDFRACWKHCKSIGGTAEIHEHIHNPNNHLRSSRASDSMATHASQERAVFLADGVHQPRSSSCFVTCCEYCQFKPPREPSLYG